MQENIEIDGKTLIALNKQIRIEVIKLLEERDMTQAELSERLQIKESSMSNNLKKLKDAQLILQIQTNRKWKYYKLTEKGKAVINGNGKFQIILNVFSIIAIILFANTLYSQINLPPTLNDNVRMMYAPNALNLNTIKTTTTVASNLSNSNVSINYEVILLILAVVIFSIITGYIIGRKTDLKTFAEV